MTIFFIYPTFGKVNPRGQEKSVVMFCWNRKRLGRPVPGCVQPKIEPLSTGPGNSECLRDWTDSNGAARPNLSASWTEGVVGEAPLPHR